MLSVEMLSIAVEMFLITPAKVDVPLLASLALATSIENEFSTIVVARETVVGSESNSLFTLCKPFIKAGNTTSATRSVTVLAPKVDAPTTYAEPLLSVNQDTNTVSIKNMGDLVKDLDGVKDVTVYLEANGVRIGNSQGLYANVLTSTSADVAYTISADYLTKNGVTGQYEPGTHTFTTKAVLDKEVPADTTPPSKVSEDLVSGGIDTA